MHAVRSAAETFLGICTMSAGAHQEVIRSTLMRKWTVESPGLERRQRARGRDSAVPAVTSARTGHVHGFSPGDIAGNQERQPRGLCEPISNKPSWRASKSITRRGHAQATILLTRLRTERCHHCYDLAEGRAKGNEPTIRYEGKRTLKASCTRSAEQGRHMAIPKLGDDGQSDRPGKLVRQK